MIEPIGLDCFTWGLKVWRCEFRGVIASEVCQQKLFRYLRGDGPQLCARAVLLRNGMVSCAEEAKKESSSMLDIGNATPAAVDHN